MAQILLVGTATLDIVFALDRYPAEDEEVRARDLRLCRGGNAANSAVVLAQAGHNCEFLGVLADAPETAVIERDFDRHGVRHAGCPRVSGRPPTSSIQLTGTSRTIVHFRDLPELSAAEFAPAGLGEFDWYHFEGRNVPELHNMLELARKRRPGVPISLELEKPRDGIEGLLGLPSVLICSRGFARHSGFDAPQGFLAWLRERAPQADLAVAWGEDGAYGLDHNGAAVHSPAFAPPQLVDTLGAGDTFNAGLIGALADSVPLGPALERACRLAGRKCGIVGFSPL